MVHVPTPEERHELLLDLEEQFPRNEDADELDALFEALDADEDEEEENDEDDDEWQPA